MKNIHLILKTCGLIGLVLSFIIQTPARIQDKEKYTLIDLKEKYTLVGSIVGYSCFRGMIAGMCGEREDFFLVRSDNDRDTPIYFFVECKYLQDYKSEDFEKMFQGSKKYQFILSPDIIPNLSLKSGIYMRCINSETKEEKLIPGLHWFSEEEEKRIENLPMDTNLLIFKTTPEDIHLIE